MLKASNPFYAESISVIFPFFTIIVNIYRMKYSSFTINTLNYFMASAKPYDGS